jgi:hypothetical protein
MGIDGERELLVFVKLLGAAPGSAYAFSFCHDFAQCRQIDVLYERSGQIFTRSRGSWLRVPYAIRTRGDSDAVRAYPRAVSYPTRDVPATCSLRSGDPEQSRAMRSIGKRREPEPPRRFSRDSISVRIREKVL